MEDPQTYIGRVDDIVDMLRSLEVRKVRKKLTAKSSVKFCR